MPRLIGFPVGTLEANACDLAEPRTGLLSWYQVPLRTRPRGLAGTATYQPAREVASDERPTPPPAAARAQLEHGASHRTSAEREGAEVGREALVLAALNEADVDNVNERAMFMAQMSHESNGFRRLTENLNYKPARLLAVFPKKFSSLADAQAVAGQGQAAIAERIYGNRPKLGNIHPGDGFKFRGRGIVQLTGRSNYQRAGRAIGIDLVSSPDKAADFDIAIQIALWFWREHGIPAPARTGNVEKVTRLINGGHVGLSKRQAEFAVWQSRLGGEHSTSSSSAARLP